MNGIKVKGHKGTWYVLDTKEFKGKTYRLLEHEQLGDNAPAVIVNEAGEEVVYPVYNGFSDLEDADLCDFCDERPGTEHCEKAGCGSFLCGECAVTLGESCYCPDCVAFRPVYNPCEGCENAGSCREEDGKC